MDINEGEKLEGMKSAEEVSPIYNVEFALNNTENKGYKEMKYAEIITNEVSPKHNVELSSDDILKYNVEEMKSDEIKDDEISGKPNVEIEVMIDDMESIDIHEKEDDREQDKLLKINDDADISSYSEDEDLIMKDGEKEILDEKEERKPFDETISHQSQDPNSLGVRSSAWTDKAAAIKKFVRLKSEVAVHTFMSRLSRKISDDVNITYMLNDGKDTRQDESKFVDREEKSIWNPLSFLKMMQNDDSTDKVEVTNLKTLLEPIVMKGRIILYTRLGCEECKQCRLYLHEKRLRYVEINIDIYPTRKLELENFCGSSSNVPKIFFNEEFVGSLNELKELDESGELEEKIKYLISKAPPKQAPLPPFSGEDDTSSKCHIDELALIVQKMKPCIVKDRFYKMRRFKNCFLGLEAVDFLSADQHLEREEAVEVARKLASQLFFQHVLDENLFEDGNHLYRFLDDDPVVSSQCHNIPRGIIELKRRPILEIASRLRLIYRTILEAYTSPDGKHVDYRSIHGSEEFARYLRIIQELHRVELVDMQREEKLAFFINLYNMMAIHAILVWGHPTGPLDRTKMFGDFKYVIGGNTYSLSSIQNGILRGNQRPPYNLMKPFSANDKRFKVALPYAEPLCHFALVCGTCSGPSLRWFSPGDIDEELLEAARNFLRGGGLIVDLNLKVAYMNKMFNWYRADFGKSEEEVLKHASTFLEPQVSEVLLDLLVDTQFRIVYQSYNWELNN